MSALRWGAGTKVVGQIIAWAMTIIVIRLLSSADYGLMAIAMMFVSFLTLLNEMGMRTVLIQKADLDDLLVRQIFGLIILLNLFLFCCLYFLSEDIARFFDEPRLVLIIKVLSAHFLISCFEIIPTSFLIRELRLKRKEIIYVVASLLGGILTLVLAYMGYGVWSLIIGNLVSAVIRSVVVNIQSDRFWIPSFRFSKMGGVLSFGGLVTLERAMWSLYIQADIFIVGKILGKELLGFYSVAMHLSSLIMHKTGAILYNVVLPTFSRVQETSQSVSYFFIKAVRLMAFFVFPMFLGMSVIANDLVDVLLGEKWKIAGGLLAILSLAMPFRMMSNLLPPALQGVGQPKSSTMNGLITFIVMPASFYVGIQWGLVGVSIAWAVAFPLTFVWMVYRSRKQLGITLPMFFGAILYPLLCSVLMYGILYLGNITILESSTSLVRMLADIGIAFLLYLVFFQTILKQQSREIFAAFRK